jgi:hypothetical protein
MDELREKAALTNAPHPVGARILADGSIAHIFSDGREQRQDYSGIALSVLRNGTDIFSYGDSASRSERLTVPARSFPAVPKRSPVQQRLSTRITKESAALRLAQLRGQFSDPVRLDSSRVQFSGVRDGRALRLVFDEGIGAQTSLELTEPGGGAVRISYSYVQRGSEHHLSRSVTVASGPTGERTFTRTFDVPGDAGIEP